MGFWDTVGQFISDYAESRALNRGLARIKSKLGEERVYAALQEAERLKALEKGKPPARAFLPEDPVERPRPDPFDPDYVFHDEQICPPGPTRFGLLEIADFFQRKGRAINGYVDPKTGRKPWESINAAALKHRVHPKILLIKLQCEEGLVRATELKPDSLAWAMNAGNPDYGPKREDKKGFDLQIDFAAELIRRHFDEFVPGVDVTVKKPWVFNGRPKNAASYTLMRFTPHAEALELPWTIWKGFFGA